MKKIILILAGMTFCLLMFGQAKQPRLIVVPSDNWCIQNGFYKEYDNQGTKIKAPDYKRSFQENSDLLLVISTINGIMADRGFELENLEQLTKNSEYEAAENALLVSESGAEMAEDPIDILKRMAQADIWLQLTWTVNITGPKKSITFILQGLDAYSSKEVATAKGTGAPSFSAELPVLLEEAVVSRMDEFCAKLQGHFESLFEKGREIVLEIGTWKSFKGNLDSQFKGKVLNEIIEDWVYDNTKEHRFSLTSVTKTKMTFKQLRIAMYDARNRAQDARRWAQGLQKYLNETYQIESTLLTKGLGQAKLVIGEN